jgi:Tfp pilus assembly protein PilN
VGVDSIMMKDLNLLPAEILNGRQAKQRTRTMVLFMVLLLLVCLLVAESLIVEKVKYENKKVTYQNQINNLKDIVDLQAVLDGQKQQISRYQAVLSAAGDSPVIYKTVLDKLEANTPEDVFILEMNITGNKLTSKCAAASKTEVSDFIRRLKDSGVFSDIFVSEITSSSETTDKGNANVNFNMACTINIQKGSTK